MSPVTTVDETAAEIARPGFDWLDDAKCGDIDETLEKTPAEDRPIDGALALFFVDAGHVISEETLNVCRSCPVRRECIIHAYLGGPGGTPIVGGYMGGFSLGQRKSMTLQEALRRAENDPPRPIRRKSS